MGFAPIPKTVFSQIKGSTLFFIGLNLFMLVITTACIVHAISWIDKPFAGFLYYQFPGVGSWADYEWPGIKAGVHYRDVILEVNGRPISTGREIHKIVEETPVGEKIGYLLARRGERFQIAVPVSVFTLRDFLKIFFIPFIIGIGFWLIGVIVYILKPNTEVTWVHFWFSLLVGTWIITGFELQSTVYPPWSYYVAMFATAFQPASAIHLSLIFPERTVLIQKWPRIPLVLYTISALLFLFHALSFVVVINAQPGSDEVVAISSAMLYAVNINRVYSLLSALAIVASSIHAFRRSSSIVARQRARVILISAGIAFVPPAAMIAIGSLTKLVIPFNFSTVTAFVFPLAIGYAIARHNLFDVDVIIKRTVGYVMMTIIVGTTYFFVQVVLRKFVLDPMFGAQAEQVYPIVFALLVVFFFNPINRRVQENVDKLFFRKQYDYKSAIAKVTDALSMTIDVNDIIHRTVGVLRKEMFVDSAGVVLLDDRKRECRSLFIRDGQVKGQEESRDLCLDYEDPLLALLANEKKLITKYDVAEDPQYVAVRESCGQRFEAMGASLALPLFSHDHVTGVLALGYKKSGHFYSREDIDLLKTVSSMTSTAIEQAREKGEKQMVMQLFSKHVSPEVAEAVWNEREQFLEGGRPKSQKLMVTVLFTDLKGFSTVSERMDPQSLMNWLNGYMDKMAKIVMDHGGVVDDYFGDAIKANFGVPLPRTTEGEIRQDAVNAVTCALAMEQEMRQLNLGMRAQSLPTLCMRVGIYTGAVVAGSLGSADRLKYTTIGDAVNTASRLESFDKDLILPHLETSPCRILIGEPTLRYLNAQFETQLVGQLSLKGKDDKIAAYCVMGPADQSVTAPLKD